MRPDRIPLFPLNVVLLPGADLPLHIFEPRYRSMVKDCLKQKSEFGMLMALPNGLARVGCTAEVIEVVKRYDDGRMDILTRGIRRFEIVMLNQEKPYLRGEVAYFDDDEPDPAPTDVRTEALRLYRSWMELEEKSPNEAVLSDAQLSFQLAQGIEDLDFLHFLLRTRSETLRLKKVAEFLSEYVPRQRMTASMKKLAPLNGHGPRGPEM